MSRLSAIRNAIFVGVNGGSRHREKRECEQARCRGSEGLRSRFHLFFFLFLQVGWNRPQPIPKCGIALRLLPDVSTERGLAIAAIRIAAIPNSLAAAL
jgi:hypothetical protein